MSESVSEVNTDAANPGWRSWSAGISPSGWTATLVLISGILILLEDWVNRFSNNPDGVSYLDIARQTAQGHPGALASSYWSPLYPAVLSLGFRIGPTLGRQELLTVHGVQALIGLAALASFTFMLGQWSRAAVRRSERPPSRLRLTLAYLLFGWSTLGMIGAAVVTPDLLVAALVYLIAGLSFRVAERGGSWGASLVLGLVLGIGYYAKAPMLPLGIALLLLLAFSSASGKSLGKLYDKPKFVRLGVAALIFLALSAPFIVTLSRQQQHLTFGESGRLNYAWDVMRNIPQFAGWTGSTPENGTPAHPIQILMTDPTVFVFRNTTAGTFPLWYDPPFFHKGLRVPFWAKRQLRHFVADLARRIPIVQGVVCLPLCAGFIALLILGRRRRTSMDWSKAWLILWPASAFLLFALVAIEPRYLAPFLVLFWLALYDAVCPGAMEREKPASRLTLLITIVGVCLFLVPYMLGQSAIWTKEDQLIERQIEVANGLEQLGLRPGDGIATVGYPFDMYYAHLAHLHVVATVGFRGGNWVYDTDKLWSLDDGRYGMLTEALWQAGARAIVSPEACDRAVAKGWKAIGSTGYCVLVTTR